MLAALPEKALGRGTQSHFVVERQSLDVSRKLRPLGRSSLRSAVESMPTPHQICWLLIDVGRLTVAEVALGTKTNATDIFRLLVAAREHLVAASLGEPPP